MIIKIKNEESARLIIELSRKTGLTLAEAITVAVREKLARISPSPNLEEELMVLAQDTGPRLSSMKDHATLLYNQEGLSR